jgi:hypothetical protein
LASATGGECRRRSTDRHGADGGPRLSNRVESLSPDADDDAG